MKLKVKTEYKTQLIDLTQEVKEAVVKSGCKNGLVNIFVPHSTCSIFVFENQDPNVARDLLKKLHDTVPSTEQYAHVGGNAEGHLKSAYLGTNVTLPVENALVIIGQWQGIFLGEFDGPRDREVIISTVG